LGGLDFGPFLLLAAFFSLLARPVLVTRYRTLTILTAGRPCYEGIEGKCRLSNLSRAVRFDSQSPYLVCACLRFGYTSSLYVLMACLLGGVDLLTHEVTGSYSHSRVAFCVVVVAFVHYYISSATFEPKTCGPYTSPPRKDVLLDTPVSRLPPNATDAPKDRKTNQQWYGDASNRDISHSARDIYRLLPFSRP
jgi:hypothetical protein